jgi:hypothetical protein
MWRLRRRGYCLDSRFDLRRTSTPRSRERGDGWGKAARVRARAAERQETIRVRVVGFQVSFQDMASDLTERDHHGLSRKEVKAV